MELKQIYLVYYTTNSYDQNEVFYKAYPTKEDAKTAVLNLWKRVAEYYFYRNETNLQMISLYKREELDEIFTKNKTIRMMIEEIEKRDLEIKAPLDDFDFEINNIYIKEIDFVNPSI